MDLRPPSRDESQHNAAGVLSATRPEGGNTELQQLLIAATFEALTGHPIDVASLPSVDADEAAMNPSPPQPGLPDP